MYAVIVLSHSSYKHAVILLERGPLSYSIAQNPRLILQAPILPYAPIFKPHLRTEKSARVSKQQNIEDVRHEPAHTA